MKICIAHRYPLQLAVGTNPALPLLFRELRSRHHDVTFISLRHSADPWLAPDGVRTVQLPLELNRAKARDKTLKSLIFTMIAPLMLRRLHWDLGFDLVYCDDSFPGIGFAMKLLAGTRTLIRLGDSQTAYALAGQEGTEPWLFRAVLATERLMWQTVDRIVVISDAFAQYILTKGVARQKIAVVPECIDLSMFSGVEAGGLRARMGWERNPIIMFHGIVVPIKGLDTFLRSAPRVLAHRPDARFVIVGDGPDHVRLRHLAYSLGIADHVLFTGWVPLKDIPGLIAECDVGVPSRSPNIGNNFVVTTALLQYWAASKPVVAPALAAIREVVQPGKNGLLFRPGEPVDLANAILNALESEDARRAMGAAGRATAERAFSAERIASLLADTITSHWPV